MVIRNFQKKDLMIQQIYILIVGKKHIQAYFLIEFLKNKNIFYSKVKNEEIMEQNK